MDARSEGMLRSTAAVLLASVRTVLLLHTRDNMAARLCLSHTHTLSVCPSLKYDQPCQMACSSVETRM